MTSDDGLVGELAERMHRADLADAAGGSGPERGGAVHEDEPLTVDLDTYEAAHEVSQWSDDEAPRARRRRAG